MAQRKRSRSKGLYRIGTVAEMTGISAHALRAWERRYRDAREPSRAEGGGRLYSEEDIVRFRLIRQLLDRGHAIRQVVGLSLPQMERMLATNKAPPAADPLPEHSLLRKGVMQSLLALDVCEADRLLSRGLLELEPRELVVDVVVPLLEEICLLSDRSELRQAHVHAYATVFRSLLCSLTRAHARHAGRPRVLVATLPGETDEYGALLAAFVTVLHEWPMTYVGPSLPAREVLESTALTDSRILLLPFVQEQTVAEVDLHTLLRQAPEHVEICLTGRRAKRFAPLVGEENVLEGLEALEARFSRSAATSRHARRGFKRIVRCAL